MKENVLTAFCVAKMTMRVLIALQSFASNAIREDTKQVNALTIM